MWPRENPPSRRRLTRKGRAIMASGLSQHETHLDAQLPWNVWVHAPIRFRNISSHNEHLPHAATFVAHKTWKGSVVQKEEPPSLDPTPQNCDGESRAWIAPDTRRPKTLRLISQARSLTSLGYPQIFHFCIECRWEPHNLICQLGRRFDFLDSLQAAKTCLKPVGKLNSYSGQLTRPILSRVSNGPEVNIEGAISELVIGRVIRVPTESVSTSHPLTRTVWGRHKRDDPCPHQGIQLSVLFPVILYRVVRCIREKARIT